MNILSLPTELLVAILSSLEVNDIISFCRVCHFTNDFVKKSPTLQYLIILYRSGMKDVHGLSGFGTRDRLVYLDGREALWTKLDLSESRKVVIPVLHRHSHISSISNGFYIFGELSEIPENIRSRNLWYTYLPHCIHGDEHTPSPTFGSEWNHFPLESEALNVCFSLERNDLVAVLTSEALPGSQDTQIFHLRLLRFSTGDVHPLAEVPLINIHEHRDEGDQCIASSSIAGTHILVLLTWIRTPNASDELYVYDWLNGSQILHISSGSFTYRGAVFLSEDTFIVTNMRENRVEFFKLEKGIEQEIMKCRRVVNLYLPTLRRGSSMISMNCRTDAIHCHKINMLLDSELLRKIPAPVYCIPEMSMIQFRMYVQGRGTAPNHGQVSLFAFVMHRGTIIRIANTHDTGNTETLDEVSAVPWEEWGPSSTRWSGPDETDTAWMSGIAGQRQVFITGDRKRRIYVRDYNINTVNAEIARLEREGQLHKVTIFTKESITSHQECFEDDIRSALSFVETESDQDFEYDGVLMDEEHIIGLTEDDEDGTIQSLHVFIMTPDEPRTCSCLRVAEGIHS